MHELLAPYSAYILAVVLPPGCFILLLLIGLRFVRPWPAIGLSLVVLCSVLLWVTATNGFARVVQNVVLKAPSPLGPLDLEQLTSEVKNQPKVNGKPGSAIAIVVLGGGLVPRSPDYRLSDLSPYGLERLRYGLWLSKATQAPLGFSGGIGWGLTADVTPEARVAERIVLEEYGQKLRWIEDLSRDTRENAGRMLPLLKQSGVRKIVLVTHVSHMPRALRAFRETPGSEGIELVAAPMGAISLQNAPLGGWLPSVEGLEHNRMVWREVLAKAAGR